MLTALLQGMLNIAAFIWNGLMSLVNLIMLALPRSPFSDIDYALGDNELMATFNWLVPVTGMQAVLYQYLLAVAIWYFNRIILRWFKVAGS